MKVIWVELDKKQEREYNEWYEKNHTCEYKENGVGAIGGRITWVITPTSLVILLKKFVVLVVMNSLRAAIPEGSSGLGSHLEIRLWSLEKSS
jgi:hypothetical protein